MDETPIVQSIPLQKIVPNPRQSRVHYPEGIRAIANSIKQFGALQPLVVYPDGDRYVVVAGHGRLAAMRQLQFETAPAIVLPAPKNEEERNRYDRYGITDNRTHEYSEWNTAALQITLPELLPDRFDIGSLPNEWVSNNLPGFSAQDLAAFLAPITPTKTPKLTSAVEAKPRSYRTLSFRLSEAEAEECETILERYMARTRLPRERALPQALVEAFKLLVKELESNNG